MSEIIVIGNGPSLHGRGLGIFIDSLPVVRLHNWGWQMSVPEDYGTRYDFGVWPGPWGTRPASQFSGHPDQGWLLYRFPPRLKPNPLPPTILGSNFQYLDAHRVPELQDVVAPGRAATRGLMMAIMAIELLGAQRLLCGGLDAVLSGTWNGYPPGKKMPEKWQVGMSHSIDPVKGDRENFERERLALLRLAQRKGVEVTSL